MSGIKEFWKKELRELRDLNGWRVSTKLTIGFSCFLFISLVVTVLIFSQSSGNSSKLLFINSVVLIFIFGMLLGVGSRMFEGKEKESLSDPLTGLANRRFFQDTLLKELRRAQRYEKQLSIIMCDIDHFKSINDTYGHNVGDEVLVSIADLMLGSVRATDFVVRYGGEEFVVLLPESTIKEGVSVAEKIRKTVESAGVVSRSRLGLRLKTTLSAGVAAYPFDGETGDGLIMKADKGLYLAKNRGRNRVCTVSEVQIQKRPARRKGDTYNNF
jgi:diguanylate cyclase (GGDEF)-like protein